LCAHPDCYQGLQKWRKRNHKRQHGKRI
jgi:hypothetical protein